jgi:signal transduction histidine kinase
MIQKDYIQRIRSSSEHLLNTVNNTLDITKLKNDTLHIENSEFDLNEMLRKVSSIISLEAKNNDTEFELNVEDDVPAFIFGDQTRIRQVLINLLGNSVKFTMDGKISLTIKTLYNYTNAITLGFNIKDTGLGMTSQQVHDIHESSADIIEGGTVGMGLSVTKQLIQMMDGEIKIYSTEDVGTTFTFTLKFNVKR